MIKNLKDLKEFLGTLSEEQLETPIEDRIFTCDGDENGCVLKIGFEVADEEYFEYGDQFMSVSSIKDEMNDDLEEGQNLEEVYQEWVKDKTPERKVGDVIIFAWHY